MKKLLYILRPALVVLLPLLLALAPAMAQNVVYVGETTTLDVDQVPGDTYSWELYSDSTVNFAQVPGDTPASDADFVGGNTGPSVQVNWKKPGIYFFKVTALNTTGCTNNLRVGIIKVIEAKPTAVIEVNPDSVCIGEWAELKVTFTGTEPWNFKLRLEDPPGNFTIQDYTNIPASQNPFIINIGPAVTTTYTVVEVTDAHGVQLDPSNTVTLTINPLPQSSRIYLKKP